jgi:hypothetical protein
MHAIVTVGSRVRIGVCPAAIGLGGRAFVEIRLHVITHGRCVDHTVALATDSVRPIVIDALLGCERNGRGRTVPSRLTTKMGKVPSGTATAGAVGLGLGVGGSVADAMGPKSDTVRARGSASARPGVSSAADVAP